MIFLQASRKFRKHANPFPPTDNALRRDGFFPEKDPSTLHNCKPYFWIRPDGSTLQAVYFTPLEDSFREEQITLHYLSHMVSTLGNGAAGFNFLSKDDPWDFKIETSSGEIINVEITAFTDRQGFFKRLTFEEMYVRHSCYDTIRLGILMKLVAAFPELVKDEEVASILESGAKSSDEVSNPLYPDRPLIFNTMQDFPLLELETELRRAISAKQEKDHDEKEKTVLILDNRTSTAGLSDFETIVPKLEPMVSQLDFPEVWLYTGYGGGRTLGHEDFLFLPLKLEKKLGKLYLKRRFPLRWIPNWLRS